MRRCAPVLALVAGASAVGWHRVVTPRHQRWGTTGDEATAPLPGDQLVADPAAQVTRAITIDAPPEAVWPWVVQLGADRGGFYSYDVLENLFGLDIHSADAIVAQWQERAVGDLVHANAKGSGGWYVMEVVPGEALVLQAANVKAGRPIRRDDPAGWEFVWSFVVRAADGDAGRSRLLVRERAAFGGTAMKAAMTPVGFVSFVMTRKMLRGIKARAESLTRR